MGFPKDITGLRSGKLIALRYAFKKGVYLYWECFCGWCGKTGFVKTVNLTRKTAPSRSCGCRHHKQTHGENRKSGTTITYNSWKSIMDRCLTKTNKDYPNYGGRCIEVCNRWRKYENFKIDMGERPSIHYSIDRIDNNGHYTKENCRWATRSEQQNNKRTTKRYSFNGQNLTVAEWSQKTGISYQAIYTRIRSGKEMREVLRQ